MSTERVGPILETLGPRPFNPYPLLAYPALSPAQRRQKAGFEAAERLGREVIARINAQATACASLHAAICWRDGARVARLLQEHGLREVRAEQLTVVGWTDAGGLRGGQIQPAAPRSTHWVYWLEVSWDPWGGLDWRIVEGCGAVSQ